MYNIVEKRALDRAEEALVVDAQIFLQRIMKEKNISRSELADRMGVTKARISQIFSDDCKNFTIRLLARASVALGEEVELCSETTKAQDAQRDRARVQRLVYVCDNATSLWEDEGEPDEHSDDFDLRDARCKSWAAGSSSRSPAFRERIAA